MASIDMMKPPMIPGHKKSVICLGTCRFGSANYGITPAMSVSMGKQIVQRTSATRYLPSRI